MDYSELPSVLISISIGLLFIFLAIPLIYKKIPPNRLYGFRTPSTLNNSELWYYVNNKMGKDLLVTGMLLVILGLLIFISRLVIILIFPVLFIGIIVLIIRGCVSINKYKGKEGSGRSDYIPSQEFHSPDVTHGKVLRKD